MEELTRVLALPETKSSVSTLVRSSRITPSTTNNGWLLPLMEALPRILIRGEVPNVPDTLSTLTPAA